MIKSKEHKLIAKNFSLLSLLQIANLILPLITLPYLLRVLEPSNYGIVIWVEAIMTFFVILINFGFNISATKSVSEFRDDVNKLNEIFSSILIIKIFLFFVSVLILLILVFSFDKIYDNHILFVFAVGVILNETLFPIWFFQGIEDMKFIVLTNVLIKSIFTVLIFIVITNKSDYIYVPLLNTIGVLIGVSFSLYVVFFKKKIKLFFPQFSILKHYFIESFPFFASRASVIVMERLNIILIEMFIGTKSVAYYDLADKIVQMSKVPFGLLNQAIYPNVSKTKDMGLVKKVIKFTFFSSLGIYAILVTFNSPIVHLLGGDKMIESANLLVYLGISIILSSLSWFYGNTVLVVKGHNREFNLSIVYSVFIYIVMVVLFYIFGKISMINLILALLLTELYQTLYRLYYIKKYQLLKG